MLAILRRLFGQIAVRETLLAAGWIALAVPPALAEESGASGGAAESSGGGMAVLDWAIVVVMIGAALFVVCRGSRRN